MRLLAAPPIEFAEALAGKPLWVQSTGEER
jgi:hypothetical protein